MQTTYDYVDLTPKMIEEFADTVGAKYTAAATLDSNETGMYNNPDLLGLETDRLRLDVKGYACEYYVARLTERGDEALRYVPKKNPENFCDKYFVLVYSMELSYNVPPIYIESKLSAWRLRNIERRLPKQPKRVELESDFNKFFNVYVSEEASARLGFEVLAPDMMQSLLTFGDDVDIEFAGRRLYFYTFLARSVDIRQDQLTLNFIRRVTISLTQSQYLKYLNFYVALTKKFTKVARQVEVPKAIAPLYMSVRWPVRGQLQPDLKRTLIAFGVPMTIGLVAGVVTTFSQPDTLMFVGALSITIATVIIVPLSMFVPPREIHIWWQTYQLRRLSYRLRTRLLQQYGQDSEPGSKISLR